MADVFKHAVLLAALAARDAKRALTYIDTHAGEGAYSLGSTGEWTEGIGRLDAAWPDPLPVALSRLRAAVAAPGRQPRRGGGYPGSPALALAALKAGDRAHLFEIDPEARAALARNQPAQTLAKVHSTDGLAALPRLVGDTPGPLLLLIDPPYTAKEDWTAVIAALTAAWRARNDLRALLWYPVKSLTRPNALHHALRAAGVPATVLELCVTPLEVKRNALHGSGMVCVGQPPAMLAECAALLPALGAALATHDGRHFGRTLGW